MSNTPDNPYKTGIVTNEVPEHVHLEKVRSVAKAQRLLNIAILMYITLFAVNIVSRVVAANDPNSIVPLLVLPYILGVLVFVIFAVARMGNAMHGVGHAIVYSIAMLIPCVGIILLLILNSRVTAFLQKNGVEVGLMGAKKNSIPS